MDSLLRGCYIILNTLNYIDVNMLLFLQQVELREVMEAEMRTQLRRQAAAHTDHLRDVLQVQERELQAEAEEVCLIFCLHSGLVTI